MAELAAMGHIVRAEENADITVKFRWKALSGAAWPTGLSMFGQVPPQLLFHAFFGIDVAIDRFLTDAKSCTFIDHPIADLLWRSALFDPFDDALAQIRMSDQLALRRTPPQRALMCSHAKVSRVLLGKGIICPEVAFDLPKDR